MARQYFQQASITTPDDDNDAELKAKCRHIFTDGHRCGSPSLRNEKFCYYHHTNRRPVKRTTVLTQSGEHTTFIVPMPDDRGAIQHTIGNILQGLASDTIDTRRAGLMLYGLQTASHNLPRETATDRGRKPVPTIDEVVDDPEWGLIAPEEEWDPDYGVISPAARLLKKWHAEERAQQLIEQAEQTRLATSSQEVKFPDEQSASEPSNAHHWSQPEGAASSGPA